MEGLKGKIEWQVDLTDGLDMHTLGALLGPQIAFGVYVYLRDLRDMLKELEEGTPAFDATLWAIDHLVNSLSAFGVPNFFAAVDFDEPGSQDTDSTH